MFCSFLSPSSEPFPASLVPQTTGQRFTKHYQLQCTILAQTSTHRCQPGYFPPSFFFHSPLALCSLYSSPSVLSLCCWPLGSTEQNWFPLFHGSWVRQRLRNRVRERGRGRERKCEYVTDIFVHLYLNCCLSPKECCSWLSHFLNKIFNMFTWNIWTIIIGFAAGQT